MAKKSENRIVMIFRLFWDGIVLYCKNLDTFLKYMFFPVIGQILGVFLIFAANYIFIVNIGSWVKQNPVLDSLPLVFTLLIICVFPGFLVFCKAFFDYLVAMASLNSMVYVSRGNKMKNKPLDTKAHDDDLKKRLGKYVALLLLLSILTAVGLFPLFIIPFGVLSVYLCLVFQVFMLEETTSPMAAFKRSFDLVKTNFAITFLLLALSFALTYCLIPGVIVWAMEKGNLVQYLAIPVQNYLDVLPINQILDEFLASLTDMTPTALQVSYEIMSKVDISQFAPEITKMLISLIVTGFLLPLRCSWFTLLYKTFDFEKTEELRKADSKRGK